MKDLIQGVAHLISEGSVPDGGMALKQIRSYVASKLRDSHGLSQLIQKGKVDTRFKGGSGRAEYTAKLDGGITLEMWINTSKTHGPRGPYYGEWRVTFPLDSSAKKKLAWKAWKTGSIKRQGDPIVAKIRESYSGFRDVGRDGWPIWDERHYE